MAALPLAPAGHLAVATTAPAVAANPWRYNAHPEIWLIVVAAAFGYWYALTRIGPRVVPRGAKVVTRRQICWFASGLAVLWVASDWPVHDLAENYLYSMHMVEHLLISLVAPPMLLLGIPGWLTRWLLRPRWLSGSVRVLARPLVAGITFNAVIAIGHAPFYVNFTLYHHFWHFWAHLLLFVVSMLMWFPVVNQLPEYPRLNPPLKMVYLFFQSLVPNVPVAFMTFSTGVVYSFYAHVPRLPAPFTVSAITDQQTAGAIMKIGGTMLLWSIIVIVFFNWYNLQQRQDRAERDRLMAAQRDGPRPAGAPQAVMPDVLTWDHVARELARSEPAEPGVTRPPGA